MYGVWCTGVYRLVQASGLNQDVFGGSILSFFLFFAFQKFRTQKLFEAEEKFKC